MARKLRRRKMGHVQRNIMADLSLGDVLYAHLLSGRSTKHFYDLAHQRATERYRRKQSIKALVDSGYAQRKGDKVSITNKGLQAIGEAIGETRNRLKSSEWDGKWRIVAFDIPERYGGLRDKLRSILKQAGFEKLQQSIWIFPHDCEALIKLIKQEPSLGNYVLYGVLEHIENEVRLKKLFGL